MRIPQVLATRRLAELSLPFFVLLFGLKLSTIVPSMPLEAHFSLFVPVHSFSSVPGSSASRSISVRGRLSCCFRGLGLVQRSVDRGLQLHCLPPLVLHNL